MQALRIIRKYFGSRREGIASSKFGIIGEYTIYNNEKTLKTVSLLGKFLAMGFVVDLSIAFFNSEVYFEKLPSIIPIYTVAAIGLIRYSKKVC